MDGKKFIEIDLASTADILSIMGNEWEENHFSILLCGIMSNMFSVNTEEFLSL